MATTTQISALKKLGAIKPGVNEYSAEGDAKKKALHSSGKSFLRGLAGDLNLPEGSYDVRSNKGGIAVSGEVTLHGESIYVQLSESCMGRGGINVMFRNCAGKKDYSGGQNNFIDAAQLSKGAYKGFVASCVTLMETAPAPKQKARP